MGFASLASELRENGKGSNLFFDVKHKSLSTDSQFNHQLKRNGFITAESLVEFALAEVNGQRVFDFLKAQFGNVSIIERLQTFYRFRVESQATLGHYFGALEENVSYLNEPGLTLASLENSS